MTGAENETSPLAESELKILSVAVQGWYRHYDIPLNVAISCSVCTAAIEIYRNGIVAVDDIAQILISCLPPEEMDRQETSPTLH